MSNYIPPNIVEKAKEIDLLTYFKMYEPTTLSKTDYNYNALFLSEQKKENIKKVCSKYS